MDFSIVEYIARKKKVKLLKQLYILLFGYFIAPALLSIFIPSTTIVNAITLGLMLMIAKVFWKMYKMEMLSIPQGFSRYLLMGLAAISVYIYIRGEWEGMPTNKLLLKLINDTTLSYLLPFLILFLPNKKYEREILRTIYKCSLWVIPLWIVNCYQLVQEDYYGENVGVYLPLVSFALFGFPEYFGKKERRVILFIGIFYFLLMLLNARRNMVFSMSMYLGIFYFMAKFKDNRNYVLNFILLAIYILVILLFSNILTQDVFNRLYDRIDDDSRSPVEKLFFLDYMHAPPEDWAFGRGLDGGYAQFTLDEETGEESDTRTVIETGYLNMLMHGGIVYILCAYGLLFIAIWRSFKEDSRHGLFRALIMCAYLLDGYASNTVNPLSVKSILFWLMIALSLSYTPKRPIYIYDWREEELERDGQEEDDIAEEDSEDEEQEGNDSETNEPESKDTKDL